MSNHTLEYMYKLQDDIDALKEEIKCIYNTSYLSISSKRSRAMKLVVRIRSIERELNRIDSSNYVVDECLCSLPFGARLEIGHGCYMYAKPSIQY